MLATLSFQDWFRFILAVWLALGPGLALWALFPARRQFDRTLALTAALGLAVSFWPIVLAWLQALGISLSSAGVFGISIAGWVIGLGLIRPQPRSMRAMLSRSAWVTNFDRAGLWFIIALTLILNLLALRHLQAGLGADSYQHTLISRLILEQGGIPDHFQPYAPLVSFTYHFGFHSLAAVVAWLSGLDPLWVVPMLGQCLLAASALTTAFLAEAITGRRRVATISAAIAGLVSVFPAFMSNWGRYPQLTGQVLLPIFLGLVWYWFELGPSRRWLPFIGWLAAGLALTHYRVTLMAASGVVVLIGVYGLMRRLNFRKWLITVGQLSIAAALALVFTAPWVGHVALSLQRGYPIDIGLVTSDFFSVDRLGQAQFYPTNGVVIGLTLVAVVVGWVRREKSVIALSLWAGLMLLLSTPRFASTFMDTVSVVMALYLPAVISVSWLINETALWLSHYSAHLPKAVWVGLIALAVWGMVNLTNILGVEQNTYLGPADLAAMQWIRGNTPPAARFMVNLFHLNFATRYVVGSDAGYWLPYLTNRTAVTAPMIYPTERSSQPDFLDRLVALDRLEGRLTSLEAVAEMKRQGITHVFIGQSGGPIVVSELLHSPDFQLDYQSQSTYVFSLR